MMYWIISIIDVFIVLYFACFTYIKEKRSNKEYERFKYPLIVILGGLFISFIPIGQWIFLISILVIVPVSICSYNDSYNDDYIKIKGFLFTRF